MPKHVKPSNEELDANIEKSVEELEGMKENKEVEEIETLSSLNEKVEEKDVKKEEESGEEETKEDEEKEASHEEEDYKKKFVESTREAQVLYSKNRKLSDVLEKANDINEATDDELVKEYPEWDVMDDFSKKLAKDNFINKKRFNTLHEATREFKDIDAWNEKVDKFVSDPKNLSDYPDIDGRENEFKAFATKPTRRGVDFSDLVSSFLYNSEKAKPKKKGKLYETGSGGEKPAPKSDKISLDDARVLRQKDFKKWKELMIAGKIEENIV